MIGVDGYILKSQAVAALSKYGLSNGSAIGHHSGAVECAIAEIEAINPVDAVPVVRCGECEYRRFSEFAGAGNIYCNLKRTYFPLDGFCNFGEQQEAAGDDV